MLDIVVKKIKNIIKFASKTNKSTDNRPYPQDQLQYFSKTKNVILKLSRIVKY